MAADGSNHGNNKNVNKIAMNAQREQEMMSDYAVVPPQGSNHGPHHQQAILLAGGSNRTAAYGGACKPSKSQRPQKMLMNNFLQPADDIL